ncbi:MAG: branched-chain amino acid ABC transporter permease [Deltaproteobacteria bacterium]|nr:branched-chain amino acid ABC transporter permease [Deltaproteobacteria bacterium]
MDLQSQIIQYLATGLTLGSIYAMVGLGFTIIYNATGIINLAQGEFVMFGGLIMVFFTTTLGLPMFVSFFITLALTTAIGMIYELLFIRHPAKKKAPMMTLLIITVAVSIFFRGIARDSRRADFLGQYPHTPTSRRHGRCFSRRGRRALPFRDVQCSAA